MIPYKKINNLDQDEKLELFNYLKDELNPVSIEQFIELTKINGKRKYCRKTIHNRMTIVKDPKKEIKHLQALNVRMPFANYTNQD